MKRKNRLTITELLQVVKECTDSCQNDSDVFGSHYGKKIIIKINDIVCGQIVVAGRILTLDEDFKLFSTNRVFYDKVKPYMEQMFKTLSNKFKGQNSYFDEVLLLEC